MLVNSSMAAAKSYVSAIRTTTRQVTADDRCPPHHPLTDLTTITTANIDHRRR